MLILGAATPVFKLSVSCFPLNPCPSSPTHIAKNLSCPTVGIMQPDHT